jgi:murein DD-endopeptidase MepM/ murein hydrolase activator NlpD
VVGLTMGMLVASGLAGCGSAAPASQAPPAASPAGALARSSGSDPAAGSPSASAAASDATPPEPSATTTWRYVFPVAPASAVSYAHTHHDYPATDIMAPCGSTVRAAIDGVVLEVTRVDLWNARTNLGAVRGGLSVSILGDDGVRYYGSHLRSIAANINPGVRVTAGETLGQVGETGDASACHLHFGISPVCARTGDWWIQRGVIWPWRYLDSWRAGGSFSPVAEVHIYYASHGCPPLSVMPDQ